MALDTEPADPIDFDTFVPACPACACLGHRVFRLRGQDLSTFDQPSGQRRTIDKAASQENKAVTASLMGIADALNRTPRSQHIALLRKHMDNMFPVLATTTQFTALDAAAVAAELVLAPNADGRRRLLYIHGGAYTLGSPKSHRRLTAKFSEIANAAGLAIDYRLMPEHPRLAGIEDCRAVYRWLMDNGPSGAGPASAILWQEIPPAAT
jgi:acetyl esterase/lipase